MNNNLLLQAAKWLTELGIRNEPAQTFLKINRDDVSDLFEGTENEKGAALLLELKKAISNKLYFDKGTEADYHLNSF